MPVKIIMIFILPVFLFVLWSYLTYPLLPHCSLGNGALGCTPMCEPTSFFEDGRPSAYKVIPCFHENPNVTQNFLYQNQIGYYLSLGLLAGLIVIKIGFKNFSKKILYIIFAPFALVIEARKKKALTRIFVIIASFFLFIEWGFGYLLVFQALTGIKMLNN